MPKYLAAYTAWRDGFSADCAIELLGELDRHKSGNREFKAGCDLFTPGEKRDVIYRLVDGWVALYSLFEDGSRQILHFALPGAVLAFAPGRVMTYSALALTDVVVGVISYERLYSLLREQPEVGLQLVA